MQWGIKVASLSTARGTKRKFDAVVTIEDPGLRNGLRFHRLPHPDHLVLRFEDVDDWSCDIAMAHRLHVDAALRLARAHEGGSILVHCKAGVARSSAMALALIADRMGPGREMEAVLELLAVRPVAVPNLVVLDLADEALGRNGALKAAWMKVERASFRYAEHRRLKREMLARNPAMYSKPIPLELTATRFGSRTLKGVPGLESRDLDAERGPTPA